MAEGYTYGLHVYLAPTTHQAGMEGDESKLCLHARQAYPRGETMMVAEGRDSGAPGALELVPFGTRFTLDQGFLRLSAAHPRPAFRNAHVSHLSERRRAASKSAPRPSRPRFAVDLFAGGTASVARIQNRQEQLLILEHSR